MKGFKPTGYGPSEGFKFPAKMGFTGSTGGATFVSPYVRRKAFASGGFVRQDNPRMKAESVGDSGSALVRRSKPTTQLDQESGGRSPLRPGFKAGGYTGGGALGAAMASKVKKPPTTGGKGKFYEDGGRIVRGSSSKGFWSDVKQLPEAALEGFKYLAKREAKNSTGIAKKGAERVGGRKRQIDDYVDRAVTGYKRGGNVHMDAVQDKPMMQKIAKKVAKKMCKADGGSISDRERRTMEVRLPKGAKPKIDWTKARDDWAKAERDMPAGGLSNLDREYLRAKSK